MNDSPQFSWKWNLGWIAAASLIALCAFVVGQQKGRSEGREEAMKTVSETVNAVRASAR